MTPTRANIMRSIGCCFAIWLCVMPVAAQTDEPEATADEQARTPLAVRQQAIAQQMAALEQKLLQLAETLDETEPQRAEKLRTALETAKGEMVQSRMREIFEMLQQRELGKLENATQLQKQVIEILDEIIVTLLQDEDDLESQLEKMRQLQQWRDDVRQLIDREQQHQRDSQIAEDRAAAQADLAEAKRRVQAILQKQRELRDQTQAARQRSIDELPTMTGPQRELAEQSSALGDTAQQGETESADAESQDQAQGETEASDQAAEAESAQSASSPSSPDSAPAPSESAEASEAQRAMPAQAKQAMQQAGNAQEQAAQQLALGRGKSAQQQQERAIEALEKAIEQIEQEQSRIERLPDMNELAEQQKQTEQQTDALAEQMSQSAQQAAQQAAEQGMETPTDQAFQQAAQQAGQNLEQAQGQMQQAGQSLEDQQPRQAGEQQEQAIDELKKSQQALEEQLKQMREEMKQRLLTALEVRYREILERHRGVMASTEELSRTDTQQWARQEKLIARDAADEQATLAQMVEASLALIVEDGTTIVLPQIVRRVHDDMNASAQLLEQWQVGNYTQKLQKQIEDTLLLILEAIERAQELAEQQQNPQQQQQAPQDQPPPPLVPRSAELKLLRSMQIQVNQRTIDLEQSRDQMPEPMRMREVERVAQQQSDVSTMTEELIQGYALEAVTPMAPDPTPSRQPPATE